MKAYVGKINVFMDGRKKIQVEYIPETRFLLEITGITITVEDIALNLRMYKTINIYTYGDKLN